MKPSIRIGCAAAFWGDTNAAAAQLVAKGELDYLVFDYLAEITMSIMAGARFRDPNAGYATDFVTEVMAPLAREIAEKKIKVIADAGGVNPQACRDALHRAFEAAGVKLNVALVLGDDLQAQRATLPEDLVEFDTPAGVTPKPLPEFTVSLNAYLGAKPIADALARGADLVVTGRIADSALVLGPLLHEFGWSLSDYDKLAQGSLAGHIIECGAQCTGGNFTDWRSVPGFDDMGFPFVDVQPDGTFSVGKPAGTGGLVTTFTVGEQLLYEIGDPRAYLLPDVVCDFTQVQLTQVDTNRVHVSGAKGLPPTDRYKASATWPDGHRLQVSFSMGGVDAAEKAQRVAEAIVSRVRRLLAEKQFADFREVSIEILGDEATYGESKRHYPTREVVVKIACVHDDKRALRLFGREIAPASTGMAPGLMGLVGGRPKDSPRIRLFSCLVPKSSVKPVVDLNGEITESAVPTEGGFSSELLAPPPSGETQAHDVTIPLIISSNVAVPLVTSGNVTVPLIKLAVARSGDKGDHANIGVMARKPEYVPFIRAALTEQAVARYMRHVLHPEYGKVTRWELPGIHAFNFLLAYALGGGGIASLRADPQGKAFAQQLLDFPVPVSAALSATL